jgi:hypothetical protein
VVVWDELRTTIAFSHYHLRMNSALLPSSSNSPSWRQVFEITFWPLFYLLNTVANSAVALIDMRRQAPDFPAWRPITWEASSSLLMLLLVPAVIWFTRRFPLHWDTWRAQLPRYLAASVVFSVVHVVGMVGVRHAVYALNGLQYDFGSWPSELFYEYLKDFRTFASMALGLEMYRLLLRRLQGEARLLDAPDAGPPVDSMERPERFLVRKLGREFLVAAADIEWLQAAGNYVNLRVAGRDYPLRSTIAGIEEKLDPRQFARVHRSHIVNLDQIASIEPLESGDARVHLRDGSVVPCSRRYRSQLRDRASTADSVNAA